jgi:RNA polymerase sigma factor (sigma-70 family)
MENESTPGRLVEHFFRHEYGRIVGVLVRSLGVRNLELAEDSVQLAMQRALQSWGNGRIPSQPAAWLLQTSRRIAIDALRRRKLHDAYLASQIPAGTGAILSDADDDTLHEIGDEPLRLLFLCCHSQIPPESSIAMALKIVGGFGTHEIAAALFISEPAVQKRIERARQRFAELSLELEPLHHPWMKHRLESVLAVIYLLFNEGYLSARDSVPIRQDLCDEALRLIRLLGQYPVGNHPQTHALAALICFHAARTAARSDRAGALVLLPDQDRSLWDWGLVREGMRWMARSAHGNHLSRYHLEAAIAWEHCRSEDISKTDWQRIVQLYSLLLAQTGGPAIVLNLAIAMSRCAGPQAAIDYLLKFPPDERPRRWPLWDTALGTLYYEAGDLRSARACLEKARAESKSDFECQVIEQRLQELQLREDVTAVGK